MFVALFVSAMAFSPSSRVSARGGLMMSEAPAAVNAAPEAVVAPPAPVVEFSRSLPFRECKTCDL